MQLEPKWLNMLGTIGNDSTSSCRHSMQPQMQQTRLLRAGTACNRTKFKGAAMKAAAPPVATSDKLLHHLPCDNCSAASTVWQQGPVRLWRLQARKVKMASPQKRKRNVAVDALLWCTLCVPAVRRLVAPPAACAVAHRKEPGGEVFALSSMT